MVAEFLQRVFYGHVFPDILRVFLFKECDGFGSTGDLLFRLLRYNGLRVGVDARKRQFFFYLSVCAVHL